MNALDKLFSEKRKDILSIYFTAGFPKLEDTCPLLDALGQAGVDMVEIGMPFSDPLADGPVIQKSSEKALKNGMSVKKLFTQLKSRDRGENDPALLLMGYLNPVLQYGVEHFCKDAAECGIAGVILPDLPMDEYLEKYRTIFGKYQLKNIFLVTPQTSEKRIRFIDEHSNSFIYLVSSASTTGVKSGIDVEQENYFKRIAAMGLKNQLMIGFGISDRTSFQKACAFASGAIIGSAFVKHLETGSPAGEFIQKIKNQV
jgi:tryptophan synthase alpha chain